MNAQEILSVIAQAAGALKYAGAKHEGVQQVLEARAAVAALIAERDALREALGGVMDRLVDRHESDEAAVIARRALTTGESA